MGGEWGQREDMVETEPIRITLEQKALLDTLIVNKKDTYADIVGRLIEAHKKLTQMNEAQVDGWGKVMISRTLKGKPILWTLKD